MAITPQSAKKKGKSFQNWVRDRILEAFPSLEPDDCVSTSMGAGGEDIKLSPAARRQIPVSIECKSNKKHAVYNYYDQAVSNAPEGAEPLLVVRADRRKPLAVLDAQYLIQLMARLKNG